MDFNHYSRNYEEKTLEAVGVAGQEQRFFIEAKARHLVDELVRSGLPPEETSLLDVGCGIGLLEACLGGRIGRIVGVDVAEEAIAIARERNEGSRFEAYDGRRLPYDDDEFDASYAACVMHHVAPAQWPRFLAEMARVTRVGGRMLIFEHNPLNPATRWIVSRCEYDADATLVWPRTLRRLYADLGARNIEERHILYTPWSGAFWRGTERLLSRRIPLGAQYYVAATVS